MAISGVNNNFGKYTVSGHNRNTRYSYTDMRNQNRIFANQERNQRMDWSQQNSNGSSGGSNAGSIIAAILPVVMSAAAMIVGSTMGGSSKAPADNNVGQPVQNTQVNQPIVSDQNPSISEQPPANNIFATGSESQVNSPSTEPTAAPLGIPPMDGEFQQIEPPIEDNVVIDNGGIDVNSEYANGQVVSDEDLPWAIRQQHLVDDMLLTRRNVTPTDGAPLNGAEVVNAEVPTEPPVVQELPTEASVVPEPPADQVAVETEEQTPTIIDDERLMAVTGQTSGDITLGEGDEAILTYDREDPQFDEYITELGKLEVGSDEHDELKYELSQYIEAMNDWQDGRPSMHYTNATCITLENGERAYRLPDKIVRVARDGSPSGEVIDNDSSLIPQQYRIQDK